MNRFLIFLILAMITNFGYTQTVVPLYKGPIPHSKESADQEVSDTTDTNLLIIRNVSRPTLSIYLPEDSRENGTAVLICPGGGYQVLAAGHEGHDVARRLNEEGITAFVLKYRIPDPNTMEDPSTGPLQDAQRAMQYIHEHAKGFGINKNRIGIMGFSAGGHLAATTGTHFNKPVLPGAKPADVKPDFMILVYPVISFMDTVGHMGSRENLLGKSPGTERIRDFSNELQVTSSTPRTFLVHAKDDEVVIPANSELMLESLRRHKVPAEIFLYEKGGHGFGMVNPTSNEKWMDKVISWIGK